MRVSQSNDLLRLQVMSYCYIHDNCYSSIAAVFSDGCHGYMIYPGEEQSSRKKQGDCNHGTEL